MRLKLIEPLRELFKDEVRALGSILKVPEALIWRHPFPGPGIAIRVLGEVTRDQVDIARKADFIFIEEIRKAGLYRKISQGKQVWNANSFGLGSWKKALTWFFLFFSLNSYNEYSSLVTWIHFHNFQFFLSI